MAVGGAAQNKFKGIRQINSAVVEAIKNASQIRFSRNAFFRGSFQTSDIDQVYVETAKIAGKRTSKKVDYQKTVFAIF